MAVGIDAGAQLFNISMGSPYYNPHIGRPFETPDDGNYEQPEHPLIGVDRHFMVAGELQRAFPGAPMVGTVEVRLAVIAFVPVGVTCSLSFPAVPRVVRLCVAASTLRISMPV